MPPCVFIVMAVYGPDPEHLKAQIASLAAQDHGNLRLVAVIADTISRDLVADLAQEAGLRTDLILPDNTLDAVRAFEAGLAEALALIEAREQESSEPLIALCDQDDIWHADRLTRGIAALETTGCDLVHSDARLVAADGITVIATSMFVYERRHKRPGLRGLLYRNNITGMTTLMRARVAQLALPFPGQSGVHFYHDLWLGLLAAATGGVHLVDAPLVDYRQHDANAHGAVDRQAGALAGITRRLKRPDAMWLRRESAAYALARYLATSTQARLSEAEADGRLIQGIARTAPLRPYLNRIRGTGAHLRDALWLSATGKPGLARIAGGFAVVNLGRMVWALRITLGAGLTDALRRFDARLYSLSPGVQPKTLALDEARNRPQRHEDLIDIRKEPRWMPVFSAEDPAMTVLVPTLNPTEIFAGIVTALDIGLGLAARGQRVRFVATDLPLSSPGASRNFLLGRLDHAAMADGTAARISLHCGVQSDTLPAHHGDIFLATAWWSAHIADKLIRRHGYVQRRFHYLIQDYEPNFYAWGPEYADALESYDLDFEPIFNTTLLRDWFADKGFGFAGEGALAFHPAIDISRYASGDRGTREGKKKRLALYGRPEVPRNMYATAIEALARFLEAEKIAPDEIELVSVGLRHAPVRLPGGHELTSLGKLPWEDYPGYLLSVDLGLSLMYSPHPSHPPLEMAASGVRVVTNSFGPKDLGQLSSAILSAPGTAPALAEALGRAWHMPPVEEAARHIDLRQLGLPPNSMIDQLAARIAPDLPLCERTA